MPELANPSLERNRIRRYEARNDSATTSLEHVLQSGEYIRVPDVALFDEHDEFDEHGNLVRRFDRAALQTIADRCNARARTSGDLSPFGPGHTFDDVFDKKTGKLLYKAKEEDQPIPMGFIGPNYRVGRYGPGGKLAIVADLYVQRRVQTKDGSVVDGLQYLKTFPRRSVELWSEDGIIDWVAVLRRTPQRDLGLLTYARAVHYVRGGDGAQMVPAAALFSAGGKTKLRYAMGESMPNDPSQPPVAAAPEAPVQPPNGAGAELPPEHQKLAMAYAKHLMQHHPVFKYMAACHAKYGAQEAGHIPEEDAGGVGAPEAAVPGPGGEHYSAGGPGGGNTFIPGLARHAMPGTPDRYARELQARDKRIEALEKANRRNVRYARLRDMERGNPELGEPGIELDIPEELTLMDDMDDQRAELHFGHIAKRYAKKQPSPADLPGSLVLEDIPYSPYAKPGAPQKGRTGKPERMSRDQVARAVSMCEADPNLPYETALQRVAAEK